MFKKFVYAYGLYKLFNGAEKMIFRVIGPALKKASERIVNEYHFDEAIKRDKEICDLYSDGYSRNELYMLYGAYGYTRERINVVCNKVDNFWNVKEEA